jgi:hypothetical protein
VVGVTHGVTMTLVNVYRAVAVNLLVLRVVRNIKVFEVCVILNDADRIAIAVWL